MILLSLFQWNNPPWKYDYNINEYWEFVKYGVTGETDKHCMVSQFLKTTEIKHEK